MLVEIAGQPMIGATLEDAARVLKNSGNTVKYNYIVCIILLQVCCRLKIGRTISSSKSDVATPLSIEVSFTTKKNRIRILGRRAEVAN